MLCCAAPRCAVLCMSCGGATCCALLSGNLEPCCLLLHPPCARPVAPATLLTRQLALLLRPCSIDDACRQEQLKLGVHERALEVSRRACSTVQACLQVVLWWSSLVWHCKPVLLCAWDWH